MHFPKNLPRTQSRSRLEVVALSFCVSLLVLGSSARARAEETRSPARSSPAQLRKGAPQKAAAEKSEATETVSLEIVAKPPRPIPPVELDMLELRLPLAELRASFADEIETALFRAPF